MDIHRLIDEVNDLEFARYLFIKENLIKGIILNDKSIINPNLEVPDNFVCQDLAEKVIVHQYVRNDPLFMVKNHYDIFKKSGLGIEGSYFYSHDVVEFYYDKKKHELKLKLDVESNLRKDFERIYSPQVQQEQLFKKIAFLLEEDLVSFKSSLGQEKILRVSPFLVLLYELQGRITKGSFKNNHGPLNDEEKNMLIEGTENLLYKTTSKTSSMRNMDLQFARILFLEEKPFSEREVFAFYENCFKIDCYRLNIDIKTFKW